VSDHLPERARLRTAEADREAVVDALRRHAALGRLDFDELGERIGRALSARTFAELDAVTADLPVEAAPEPRLAAWRRPLVLMGGELAVVDAFFVTAWLLSGHHGSFWPGWILLITAFLYLRRVLREQLHRARRRERAERRAG